MINGAEAAQPDPTENGREQSPHANETELATDRDDINFSFDFERSAERIAETETVAGNDSIENIAASAYAILPPVDSAEKLVTSVEVESITNSKIRPIAQLHDSFIIAVDDEGLLLIDQHVAHERILFDKFRYKETVRSIESQNLLLPETIDLSPAQAEAFQLVAGELESLGFNTMQLSGRTIAIKSVPPTCRRRKPGICLLNSRYHRN